MSILVGCSQQLILEPIVGQVHSLDAIDADIKFCVRRLERYRKIKTLPSRGIIIPAKTWDRESIIALRNRYGGNLLFLPGTGKTIIDKEFAVFFSNECSEILHQLGHLVGLNDCVILGCVMRNSDNPWPDFCDRCKKILKEKN